MTEMGSGTAAIQWGEIALGKVSVIKIYRSVFLNFINDSKSDIV